MTIEATRTEFDSRPRPTNPQQWLERAREVAALLAVDAAQRDHAGATPYAEIALLKDSGLVTLLGPVEHGGGGQEWPTAYRVVREIAAVEEQATSNRWFFGGAVNPRDSDVVITDEGDTLVFNGRKSFSTGSRVSDVTVLEGVLSGTDTHLFAIVPSTIEGLTFNDDWDNIGQRLTESGGVRLDGVRVDWAAAAGFVDKVFTPKVYNTLNVPTIQLVFVNFYLGIAEGALSTAATYTREKSRSWLHGGYERAVDEPYVLDTYGDLYSKLWAAEALADAVATEALAIHRNPESVTAAERGAHEVRVAAAKARATDVALEVTSRVFEVTGARATARSEGLDRFWRNVRTHTLHDPVAYKRREVGVFQLRGEIPEPTWYS